MKAYAKVTPIRELLPRPEMGNTEGGLEEVRTLGET